jgi:hypothetical protein
VRVPRETRLAGLGLCSYDLGRWLSRSHRERATLASNGGPWLWVFDSVGLQPCRFIRFLDGMDTVFVLDDARLLIPKPFRLGK